MMNLISTIQQKLDKVLLPYGITSHHIRRVEIDHIERDGEKIEVNKDEYVVFRIISSPPGNFGDGKLLTSRTYVDVNYYYSYEKNDSRVKEINARLNAIIKEFTSNIMIRLANGQRDITDIDNPYRGINVEFLFIGVCAVG